MYYLEIALRIMHILGAVVLLGGIVFQRFVLFPALTELSEGEAAERIRQLLRGRIARLTMLSAALLLISGLVNTARVSIAYRFPDGDYNLLLAGKLVLAMGVFYLASALAGRSASAEKLRANATKWLNVLLLAAILIIVLGAAMKSAVREPKRDSDTPAAQLTTLPDEMLAYGLHWEAYLDGGQQRETKRTG
jgi:hypothetical protein